MTYYIIVENVSRPEKVYSILVDLHLFFLQRCSTSTKVHYFDILISSSWTSLKIKKR